MIIAIDPGKSGGLAIRWTNQYGSPGKGKKCLIAFDMPSTNYLLAQLIYQHVSSYKQKGEVVECYIEKVHAMPKQGVTSSFNFGKHVGVLEGLALAYGLKIIEVTPQKWMSFLGLGKRGKLTKTEWKTKLLGAAQKLYPDQFRGLNKTAGLKIADALLIMEYAIKTGEREKHYV